MPPPPETVIAPAKTRMVRVLVIEPAACGSPLRELLHGIAEAGFRVVHEFPSAPAAAEALDRDSADLVIADIGEDALRNLAQLSAQPALDGGIPFVVVDRDVREDIARHALEIGAQDYLVASELTPERLERSLRWAIARASELRKLRRSNDLFQMLLTHVPDRIYFKDRNSRFIQVSRSVAEAHGFSDPATLIEKSDFSLYPAEQAEETFLDEQQVIETSQPIVGKIAQRTLPDGTNVWLSSTKLPLQDRRGHIIGTFGITRDVTELKNLEIALADERNHLDATNRSLTTAIERLQRAHAELQSVQLQLIEAEKLKSIGRLAAGVAHEVKNPLAILSMGIEFLAGKYAHDETTAGVLKELSEAVSRADGVIKGMLDFSAPRKLEIQACDVNAIIRTALRLVRGEIRKDIHQIDLQLGENPIAEADRSKMCQVFVNLFTNALHAMPDGGTLTIRSRTDRVPEDGATEGFAAGEAIVIVEIEDTGTGIPVELLERIFEPFFTTKVVGKGSGLGMSIVRSIMNLQRGSITIANQKSGGAIATVTFRSIDQS